MMKQKPRLEIQIHSKRQKIFINTVLKAIFVGEIEDGVFYVYDNDNYHEASKGLGLDNIIIESPQLKYRWITFHLKKSTYTTTRTFFYHKGKKYKMFNSRDQKFLPLDLFGRLKAIDWEDYMENLQTAQLDLFKVLSEQVKTNETNNEYLKRWEEANQQVREFKHKQRRLIL